MNQLAKKLSVDDQSLLEHQFNQKNVLQSMLEQSQIIVIIMKQFYQDYITDIMKHIFYLFKSLKK